MNIECSVATPSPLERATITGKIITALETLLAEYPGESDLANGEAWL